jgi:ergothioneine biosynthesis protein EgtB
MYKQLIEKFLATREQTKLLIRSLSDEDCCSQSMEDASPAKWHLAHTTWFFETFILECYEKNFSPFNCAFRVLFNSYYEGVGEQYPRNQRGMISRPSVSEVIDYREDINRRLLDLLEENMALESLHRIYVLIELGIHHEQQHQELLVTDIKHLLSMNPLLPPYTPPVNKEAKTGSHGLLEKHDSIWNSFDPGIVEIGHTGQGFFYDNETPRHRQFLESFSMASTLVTNKEYLSFIEDGGYQDPMLWLSSGWSWVQENKLAHPLYWKKDQPQFDTSWGEFTSHGLESLDPNKPVLHISFFEAEAYARWSGARLPSEAEWEHAAQSQIQKQSDYFGVAWQWTVSSYAPYPGYVTAPGAIGEYNGKFMVNQYVLRGSSCATPKGHARLTYRNFFPASARWQFSSIRLAKS